MVSRSLLREKQWLRLSDWLVQSDMVRKSGSELMIEQRANSILYTRKGVLQDVGSSLFVYANEC